MADVAFLGGEFMLNNDECSDCAAVFLAFIIPIVKLFANVLGHRLEGGLSPTRSHMRKWMNADLKICLTLMHDREWSVDARKLKT